MTLLEDILEKIETLDKKGDTKAQAALKKEVIKQTGHLRHVPNPGPQTQAYLSKADVLLYGGEAGGGKSGLLVILAQQEHQRSLLMRRQFTDLGALIEDCLIKYGSRDGFSGASPARLRTKDGRLLEFGAAKLPGDEESWQGQAHDLLAIDEATQFMESQIRFLTGWVRPGPGVPEDQRCRVILATNPPTKPGEGQWVKTWFAPWLDKTHRLYPAIPGKLLWRVSDVEGNFLWVDGPKEMEIGGKMVKPESLTYIPASLSDNPFLINTNYAAKLDSLPEPLRSAVRDGNWMISHDDDEWQVIPTNWILAAQARWTRNPPKDAPMCALGVDVARGGQDSTVIQPRYDTWFDEPRCIPGKDTPDGPSVAAWIVRERKHNCPIGIDMGGGYGGAVYDHLKTNLSEDANKILRALNGSNKSTVRTRDRQLSFFNRRAEWWWKFREALDPGQEGGSPVMLPPNSDLVADLTMPRYDTEAGSIKIEGKKAIIKRLGRSPDYGDAAVMAWAVGKDYTTHGKIWRDFTQRMSRPFKVTTSKYPNRKRR